MPRMGPPSRRTTLGILLGASTWPSSSLRSSPAFAHSAEKVREYFCHPHRFGLPAENWLDLFDTRQNHPDEVIKAISTFLDGRLSRMKESKTPARDLLFYYIGHGVFASGHDEIYHLALRGTRDDSLRTSAIAMAALADVLKAKARYLRRIVILDCCFAAEAFKYMQAAPDQVAIRQTLSAFQEEKKSSGFPRKGTTLLCSSGHKEPSLILPDERGTMFSEAFIHALTAQNAHHLDKTRLSLYDLATRIEESLESLAGGDAPKLFISSPDQSDGDIARIPFFPKPVVAREQINRIEETSKALQVEKELAHRTAVPEISKNDAQASSEKKQFQREVNTEIMTTASNRAIQTVQSYTSDEPQIYTALDVGTAYAKAMIIEVQDEVGVVLGVGRHSQNYGHMSDGIITDIAGVIANCNEALLQAEKAAGGLVAPNAIIGIAGELVKGSSITVTTQRRHPMKPITSKELESAITRAQKELYKKAKEQIATEIGYSNIDVRLTNSAVISANVDGYILSNPIGFHGRHFTLTLFSAFAPLTQLGALETVAQGLDLTLMSIVVEPYALARCLSDNTNAENGAIFIDVGGGTTDIALVRQGGIEETRMFSLGGRTFTRRLAGHKGIALKEAEKLKVSYSRGTINGSERDEIRRIFAPEVETWIASIDLLIDELSKGTVLPPTIYMVGGGSELPDLSQALKSYPWAERLPFPHQPTIQTVQPEMVVSIADPSHLLKDAQDITPMALAYQALELQGENNSLDKALGQVITNLRV